MKDAVEVVDACACVQFSLRCRGSDPSHTLDRLLCEEVVGHWEDSFLAKVQNSVDDGFLVLQDDSAPDLRVLLDEVMHITSLCSS